MAKAKTAAVLSMVGALSLASYGSANAAPLTPLSAAAKPTAQETGAVQVRWGGWAADGLTEHVSWRQTFDRFPVPRLILNSKPIGVSVFCPDFAA